jgi:hypothetical protein
VQQVVGYLSYTGRDANVAAEVILDPERSSGVAKNANYNMVTVWIFAGRCGV